MSSENNRAYSAATTLLRHNHKDEFEKLLTAEYERRGLSYRPRVSPVEREERAKAEKMAKARARVDAIVTEFGAEVLPKRIDSV
jgi:hypothetical protein